MAVPEWVLKFGEQAGIEFRKLFDKIDVLKQENAELRKQLEEQRPKRLSICPFCRHPLGTASDGFHTYEHCQDCGADIHPPNR